MKKIKRKLVEIYRAIRWRADIKNIDKPFVYCDDIDSGGFRQVGTDIISHNMLGVLVTHNGVKGGHHRYGGFVEITLSNESCTMWEGKMYRDELGDLEEISFRVKGDAERETLIRAFEQIVKELKNNGNKLIK